MQSRPAPKHRKGLVIVNTGTSKGNTTAAFGLVFRARARGMAAGVLRFIKAGTTRFGEIRAQPGIEF